MSDPVSRLNALLEGRYVIEREGGKATVGVAFWALGVVMLAAAPLSAQSAISGTVIETETGAPVIGAAVVLLDLSGEQVAWRLTDVAGEFGFEEVRAGTYSLRTDRIGHVSVESDPFTVERGTTVMRRLDSPVEVIILAGIDVAIDRRCKVRPGQGEATAMVWEEARKALEAAWRTSETGIYRYTILRYQREMDARALEVRTALTEIVEGQEGVTAFYTQGIDDLLEHGFMRRHDGVDSYYGPDAEVLLSDPFLDSHCMSLSEGADEAEGLLGLSFQPVEDRGVADISGVLWLDPSDSELQWLDFRYEFLDAADSEELGGRIRFSGLPDGTWIVHEWYIRAPIVGWTLERSSSTMQLIGIKEDGGSVMQVYDLEGDLVIEWSGNPPGE
jgi:hypothetical protein